MARLVRLQSWIETHPRLFSALALGGLTPVVCLTGVFVTLGCIWTLQTSFMAPNAPVSLAIWLIAPAVSGVPLWLLVRWAFRMGGWRAIGGAVLVVLFASASFYALATVEQRIYGTAGMAGVGAAIACGLMVMLAVVLVGLALVVSAIERRRGRRDVAVDSA